MTEQNHIEATAHEFGWRENYSDAGKTVYIRGDYVLTVRWSRHNVMSTVLGKGGAKIAVEGVGGDPYGRAMLWLHYPADQDPAGSLRARVLAYAADLIASTDQGDLDVSRSDVAFKLRQIVAGPASSDELTERVAIEALALELGWSINQAGPNTAFGYNGKTLTVTWSLYNSIATRAIVTDAKGQETARREHYAWQTRCVGDWVEMILRAIVTARPAQGATA
jgi:hypothetical protein